MFTPGTLWQKLGQASKDALARGALQPIPTEFEFVEDHGVKFFVRIVAHASRKPRERLGTERASTEQPNPFLPYETAMYVADASDTHVCLLNKFNVVDRHLLIVTKEFEDQQSPLNLADFQALARCLAEYEGLAFYNAGAVAGASQPHKHLQLVPLPLVPGETRLPVEPLLDAADLAGLVDHVAGLPFRHAGRKLDAFEGATPDQAARMMLAAYREVMQSMYPSAFCNDPRFLTPPYNLLITRRWMLCVPRQREFFHGVSLNALAFAGAMLVHDKLQLVTLRKLGPMAALQHTAFARNSAGG